MANFFFAKTFHEIFHKIFFVTITKVFKLFFFFVIIASTFRDSRRRSASQNLLTIYPPPKVSRDQLDHLDDAPDEVNRRFKRSNTKSQRKI